MACSSWAFEICNTCGNCMWIEYEVLAVDSVFPGFNDKANRLAYQLALAIHPPLVHFICFLSMLKTLFFFTMYERLAWPELASRRIASTCALYVWLLSWTNKNREQEHIKRLGIRTATNCFRIILDMHEEHWILDCGKFELMHVVVFKRNRIVVFGAGRILINI